MNSIDIAIALIEFQQYLAQNLGETIGVNTIAEFAQMQKAVGDALYEDGPEDEDDD